MPAVMWYCVTWQQRGGRWGAEVAIDIQIGMTIGPTCTSLCTKPHWVRMKLAVACSDPRLGMPSPHQQPSSVAELDDSKLQHSLNRRDACLRKGLRSSYICLRSHGLICLERPAQNPRCSALSPRGCHLKLIPDGNKLSMHLLATV